MAARKKGSKKANIAVMNELNEVTQPAGTAPTVALIDTTKLRLLPAQQARVDEFLGWLQTMEHEAKPFRFLDLPAEIRNDIYILSFATSAGTQDLNKHSLPNTSSVCRQMRQESLPLFYSETPFHVVIYCNFHDASLARKKANNEDVPSWQEYYISKSGVERCGRLGMKQVVKNSVRQAKSSAIFRNVTYKIVPCPGSGTHSKRIRKDQFVFQIVLCMGHEGLHYQVENGILHPLLEESRTFWPFGHLHKTDVEMVQAKAGGEIKKITERQSIIGLTLSDLEKISRSFRLPVDHE